MNRLLSVQDLADQLGISVATIYRKRSLKEPLPQGFSVGRHVRWTQETVDDWIAAQQAG